MDILFKGLISFLVLPSFTLFYAIAAIFFMLSGMLQKPGKHCHDPAGIYLFKDNSGNTRMMPEICSKFKIET